MLSSNATDKLVNSEKSEFCPVLEMIEFAMDQTNTPDLRFKACAEVAQYIYPKKKAVDVNARDGGTFEIVLKQYNNASNDEENPNT